VQRVGARLGALLRAGDVVCLSGEMGAGKTALSIGIGRGWGAQHPLTSPTFNLVHTHTRPRDEVRLYHLDCYRLSDVSQTDAIGLPDILADMTDGRGVALIEWPEHIEAALPAERLWVELYVLEATRRTLSIEGRGARAEQLVEQLRQAAFGGNG
jgi:tRNA threonylcarbamoyladenosine biosynthesis protein TsaE